MNTVKLAEYEMPEHLGSYVLKVWKLRDKFSIIKTQSGICEQISYQIIYRRFLAPDKGEKVNVPVHHMVLGISHCLLIFLKRLH